MDGTPIQLSAKPNADYIFDRWVVNGSNDVANPLNLTMDRDYTVSAYFAIIPTYTVGGTVQDATGTPLAEVRVSAEGTAYSTQTIADGSFILAVPQGTYTIAFEKAGYKVARVLNVPVTGNVQLTQPVTISPIPLLGGVPWYAIAVPVAVAVIYLVMPKRKGAKK